MSTVLIAETSRLLPQEPSTTQSTLEPIPVTPLALLEPGPAPRLKPSLKLQSDFFDAISSGSVTEQRKLLDRNGSGMGALLAESRKELGETPLLLAIRHRRFSLVIRSFPF